MPEPTMTAAVLTAVGEPLRIETRPLPVPGPDQVLVRVRAAGVCHTDLHLTDAVPDAPPLPLVLGHEIAGEVTATGAGSAIAPGTRVLVYYYDGCGDCRWCADGLENLCRAQKGKWGFDTDGGFAEYVLVPARCLLPLPDNLPYAEAAVLGCSGTTGVHVVDAVAEVTAGETVTVIGAGGVGLAAIQVATARGAAVAAVEPNPDSRAAAERLGAKASADPTVADPVAAIRAFAGGRGCDVVIDTVGTPRTVSQAIAMIRPRGRVVLVGYTGAPATVDVAALVTSEARVLGSVGATLAEARETLRLAEAGQITALIAGRYPVPRANEALDRLRAGAVTGRLVLEP